MPWHLKMLLKNAGEKIYRIEREKSGHAYKLHGLHIEINK